MKEQKLKPLRYLALGDSYTIGESVDTAMRFPVLLGNMMDHKLHASTYVEIIATTGWTTDELMMGIRESDPSGIWDMVTLLIGVNNQFRAYDTAVYRTEFTQLLEQAISFAGNVKEKVIVVSIPDYGVTPFAEKMDADKISLEIDIFNDINHSVSNQYGIAWIDVTEISRQAKDDPSLIAEDGLHPSGKMYSLWAKEILPVALQMMK